MRMVFLMEKVMTTDLIKGNSESAKIYKYLCEVKTPMSNKQIAHDLNIPMLNVSPNMSQLRSLGYATYTREGRKTFWSCSKERLEHPQRPIALKKTKSVKLRSSSQILEEIKVSHDKLLKELHEAIARETKMAEDQCFNDFLEFRQAKV